MPDKKSRTQKALERDRGQSSTLQAYGCGRLRYVFRRWTSPTTFEEVEVPSVTGADAVWEVREKLVTAGMAQSPQGVCLWTSEKIEKNKLKDDGDAIHAYLNDAEIDRLVSHVVVNMQSPASPSLGDSQTVSREQLYRIMLSSKSGALPPASLRSLGVGGVGVGRSKKLASDIPVADHASMQRFVVEASRLFAQSSRAHHARLGARWVQVDTESDILLNAWSVHPFAPQFHNNVELRRIHLSIDVDAERAVGNASGRLRTAVAPYEFQIMRDSVTRDAVIDFTTEELLRAWSEQVGSDDSSTRNLLARYFPLATVAPKRNVTYRASIGYNTPPPDVDVRAISVRRAVATTHAAPSVYRMLPSLHGVFADTLPTIFAMIALGDTIPAMQMVAMSVGYNKTTTPHIKVEKDIADPIRRRRISTWLRANKGEHRLLLLVLLDIASDTESGNTTLPSKPRAGALGTATVALDDDLSLRATFENVPDLSLMGQLVALVNKECVSRINDVLGHVDAPVRVRPLLEPFGTGRPFGAHWDPEQASFSIEAADIGSGASGSRLRETLRTGRHPSFALLSRDTYAFRMASGFSDPRHIMDAAYLASKIQNRNAAIEMLVERFRISEDEAQEAIDLSLSGAGAFGESGVGGDAEDNVALTQTLPSVRVQAKYASVLQIELTGATPRDALHLAQALEACGDEQRHTNSKTTNGKSGVDGISYVDSLVNEMQITSSSMSATKQRPANNATTRESGSVPRGLLLENLHRADPALFSGTSYAKICGHVDKRQPVVITPEERDRIDTDFPGSYGARAVAHGSSAATAARNLYICPPVWCPVSRVSMTLDQLEANGGRCPGGAEETPIRNDNKYFKAGARHIGFLDPAKHPAGLCLPCCFNKPDKRMATCGHSKNKTKISQTSNQNTGNDGSSTKGVYYVMHEGIVPLPSQGRLGALPSVFGPSFRYKGDQLVRVGSSGAPLDTSLLRALADVHTDGSISDFLGKVRAVVADPLRFLDLEKGRVAASLMRRGDVRDILESDTRFAVFVERVTNLHDAGLNAFLADNSRQTLLDMYDAEAHTASDSTKGGKSPANEMTSLVREARLHASHERMLQMLSVGDVGSMQDGTILVLSDALSIAEGCVTVVVQHHHRRVDAPGDHDEQGGNGPDDDDREWTVRLPDRIPPLSPSSSWFAVILEIARGVFERVGVRWGASDTNKRRAVDTRFRIDGKYPKPYPLIETIRDAIVSRASKDSSKKRKGMHKVIVEAYGESSFRVFSSDGAPLSDDGRKIVYAPHARHVVEDRVFLHPLEAEIVQRDRTREDALRFVVLSVRSDLQTLLALSSMRSAGIRPPEKIPETRKRATHIVNGLLRGSSNHAFLDPALAAWVAEHLLFAEEPLSMRQNARVVDDGAIVFVGEAARQELLDTLKK